MMWKRLCSLALGCGLVLAVTSSSRAECKLARAVQLPVTLQGALPLTTVQIDGTELTMLIHSASGYSFLSERTARALKLVRDNQYNFDVEGLSGTSSAWATRVSKLKLGDHEFRDVSFLVAGHEEAPSASGILGRNILNAFDTEYDLGGGFVRLLQEKGCEKTDLAYWAGKTPYTIAPLEDTDPGKPEPVTTVTINGHRLTAVLNSAARISVLNGFAARRVGVVPSPTDKGASRSVTEFQIGDEVIKNTAIHVKDLGTGPDLVLGADFFLSHRILISPTQRRIYISYGGGPVFRSGYDGAAGDASSSSLQTGPGQTAMAGSDGLDADGYARRAAAFRARGELQEALAALDKAVEAANGNADYLERRAELHLQLHQPTLAMDDAEAALRLKPDDARALLVRAGLRLNQDDDQQARADVDAAEAAEPKDGPERLAIAADYTRLGAYPEAIRTLDEWIAAHDADVQLGAARNGRCWARALANVQLDQALADCNAAVRAWPKSPAYRDSRGLVFLRLGDLRRARADYDAALALNPKLAWSLYCRGLIELKEGDLAKGEQDLASAAAVTPKLMEFAAKVGLSRQAYLAPAHGQQKSNSSS